jgi:DNA-binding NtrC family response regulator
MDHAASLGVFDFLYKPFDIRELNKIVYTAAAIYPLPRA